MSIGTLHLAGRVVGDTRPDLPAMLAGDTARERIGSALASAFGGAEVIVIRALRCRAVVGPDVPGSADALPRAITASVGRILRDHPLDDDVVVRFPDTAAFLAAYLRDCLDGRGDRWYYAVFARYRRPDRSVDWTRLFADHRTHLWQVFARAQDRGDLETVLRLAGPELVAEVAGDPAPGEPDRWAAPVATAAGLVRAAAGEDRLPPGEPERVAARLAATRPAPDWQDAESLGAAIGAAARELTRSTSDAVPSLTDSGHDWFDREAFTIALSNPDLTPPVSPRTRRVLADLGAVVADPRLRLDPAEPAGPANLVRLLTALIRYAPRWRDDDQARSVAAHVLRCWAVASSPESPRRPVERAEESRRATVAAGPVAARATGSGDGRSLAYHLGLRFSRPGSVPAATAGGLLLARGLADLGLTTAALALVGPAEPLLAALLRRWAGRPIGGDPLLDLAGRLALDRRADLAAICDRVTARLPLVEPFRRVTVPWGAAGQAVVVVDARGRILPSTSDIKTADDPTAMTMAAAALNTLGPPAGDDPDELRLDLLAVCCVQEWARWLPGFATASVPFLLDRFVRRPGVVRVAADAVEVRLPSRPHDVVLRLAKYFDPLEPPTVLGRHRITFVPGGPDER